MKIIYKHLFREYLGPLTYCVAGFVLIFLLCDLFGHLARVLNAGLSVPMIFLFFTARTLPSLEYLLPAALLFATLYTLWQLGRNNEITAMRAGGISIHRISIPFLTMGLALSVLSLALKECVVPTAMQWERDFRHNGMKPVEQKVVHDQPFYNASENRRWWVRRMDLRNPTTLYGVELVFEDPSTFTVKKRITAAKAKWMDGNWWLFDGKIERYSAEGGLQGEPASIRPFPFGMEMPHLTETPRDFVNDRKSPEYMSAAALVDHLARHPNLSDREKARRKTLFHSRLALPWACIIVVLFGIPAGMSNSRQDALTGVLIAVTFFLGFWALMQLGTLLGMSGLLAPWLGAWMSNIVFLGSGIFMLVRMR
jgi:lipopolysaccharide export system permease protein